MLMVYPQKPGCFAHVPRITEAQYLRYKHASCTRIVQQQVTGAPHAVLEKQPHQPYRRKFDLLTLFTWNAQLGYTKRLFLCRTIARCRDDELDNTIFEQSRRGLGIVEQALRG